MENLDGFVDQFSGRVIQWEIRGIEVRSRRGIQGLSAKAWGN